MNKAYYFKIRIANMLFAFMCFILAVSSNISFGATYYVSSSSGDDSYQSSQAREQRTPWKSIDKVNSFFKYLKGGDTVLFKRGDVFPGVIIPSKSGSYFAPIYFGAYGTGTRPEISGLVHISSWKEVRNGIYVSESESTGTNL